MLELGRQLEIELHTGVLAPSASTTPGLGMAVAGGGTNKGGRSTSAGATGSRGAGRRGVGAGADAEGGGAVKHHPGLLSESEESRLKARGIKVDIYVDYRSSRLDCPIICQIRSMTNKGSNSWVQLSVICLATTNQYATTHAPLSLSDNAVGALLSGKFGVGRAPKYALGTVV